MTVFVAGVHCVGKSYLCRQYAETFSVTHESASNLIRNERAQSDWSVDKKVSDIEANQVALRAAVKRLEVAGSSLLLDGHFVLINDKSKFVSLDATVFQGLGISGVVLIEADASVIESRLSKRDFAKSAVNIELFMMAERAQARRVCEILKVPLCILFQPDFQMFSETTSALFLNEAKKTT